MIFTIQFDTEKDDMDQIKRHFFADDYAIVLSEVREYLRNKYKHGNFKTKEAQKLADDIYEEFCLIIENSGIEI